MDLPDKAGIGLASILTLYYIVVFSMNMGKVGFLASIVGGTIAAILIATIIVFRKTAPKEPKN